MKCRTCARRLDLEKLDYTVGCKHEQMEGFVCLACAFEGVAYWMTNISEDDYCEEYVEKQVTGKLIDVEIPTKRESEEEEKQVSDEHEEMLQRFAQIMRNLEDMKILLSQRTGHWIEDEEQNHVEVCYHCSECGFEAWGEHEKTSFCGGCGAWMTEREGE